MEKRCLTGSLARDELLPVVESNNQPGFEQRLKNAEMLVARLERLSADSYWAHQASGLRGSLLRCLEEVELSHQVDRLASVQGATPAEQLDRLVDQAFEILVRAAQEVSVRSVLSNESK